MDVTNNPIFKSKSPSDFWSKRWNLLIHGLLKVSLYSHMYTYIYLFLCPADFFMK